MKEKTCRVIKEYHASTSDPIILKKGDLLEVENRETDWKGWIYGKNKQGKEGWIPKHYLQIDKKRNQARTLKDYNAIELNVSKGEIFIIKFEESGWIWVYNESRKAGWIPLENVEII